MPASLYLQENLALNNNDGYRETYAYVIAMAFWSSITVEYNILDKVLSIDHNHRRKDVLLG